MVFIPSLTDRRASLRSATRRCPANRQRRSGPQCPCQAAGSRTHQSATTTDPVVLARYWQIRDSPGPMMPSFWQRARCASRQISNMKVICINDGIAVGFIVLFLPQRVTLRPRSLAGAPFVFCQILPSAPMGGSSCRIRSVPANHPFHTRSFLRHSKREKALSAAFVEARETLGIKDRGDRIAELAVDGIIDLTMHGFPP